MREINACGKTSGGAGATCNNPSTRIRSTIPLRNGST